MKCKDIELLLSAYADDELAQTQREFVETHLKTCIDCQALLAEQKRIFARLAGLRDLPSVPDIKAKTMARIKGDGEPNNPWRLWRPALAAIPLTLALVIALIWNLPSGNKPITSGELVAAVLQNSASLTSYRSDGVITFTSVGTDGRQAITETTIVNLVDIQDQVSHTDQTTKRTTSIGGMTIPDETSARTETYYVNGWAYKYIHTSEPNSPYLPGVWYKMEMPPELWATFSFSEIKENQNLIDYFFDDPQVTILGTETVNGMPCYKVDIQPDLETTDENVSLNGMSITGWIDQDSFGLVKSEIKVNYTLTGGKVVDQRGVYTFSQVNETEIVLPAALADAIEIPSNYTPPETISLEEILEGVKRAAVALDSLKIEMSANTIITSSGGNASSTVNATLQADADNQRYYLIQDVTTIGSLPLTSSFFLLPTDRTEFYFLQEATYERHKYSVGNLVAGVWYRQPGMNEAPPPALASFYPILVEMLETASIGLGSGGVNDVECYSLNVTGGYLSFIPGDPSTLSKVSFNVLVDKRTFQILAVNVRFTSTQGGMTIEVNQFARISQFNAVTVTVPPEVLSALPPPSPPPPTTPPAS